MIDGFLTMFLSAVGYILLFYGMFPSYLLIQRDISSNQSGVFVFQPDAEAKWQQMDDNFISRYLRRFTLTICLLGPLIYRLIFLDTARSMLFANACLMLNLFFARAVFFLCIRSGGRCLRATRLLIAALFLAGRTRDYSLIRSSNFLAVFKWAFALYVLVVAVFVFNIASFFLYTMFMVAALLVESLFLIAYNLSSYQPLSSEQIEALSLQIRVHPRSI
ncbi:hypothetical protein IT571_04570 [Candidatus Sumerlaeota bacterium]|nr:hypothetical protein [Candidatus Sumerlaeota bacterium]